MTARNLRSPEDTLDVVALKIVALLQEERGENWNHVISCILERQVKRKLAPLLDALRNRNDEQLLRIYGLERPAA